LTRRGPTPAHEVVHPSRVKVADDVRTRARCCRSPVSGVVESRTVGQLNGAHLNTVRPEYLLSWEEFKKFIKLRPKEISSKLQRENNMQNFFLYVQNDAWITLFYQIMKIYYLNRVTPKSFKNLPGMPPGESNIEPAWMQGSNVYSLAECILLKWMTYHYNQKYPTHQKQLTNFDDDLKSGVVFAALIEAHYGPVKELREIIQNPTRDHERKANAIAVKKALEEIKVQTHIEKEDIMDPRPREMVLFCVQLYQALPHYIPKADIEFPAVLGDLVTKNIELSNPSKNPICYRVDLEPPFSQDFRKEDEEVRIEPGQTVNFPVKF
jgi:hypothetical protein